MEIGDGERKKNKSKSGFWMPNIGLNEFRDVVIVVLFHSKNFNVCIKITFVGLNVLFFLSAILTESERKEGA